MKRQFAFGLRLYASLFLLLSTVAGFCADPEKPAPASPKKITADEAEKMMKDKMVIVLDVRSPQEFAAGHIAGSTNINVRSPDFTKRVSELDKSQTYLVHCARGVRSADACGKMQKLQFKSLYDFSGGFEAWTKAGKKVEK